jgi:hypothetical protein
MNNKKSEGKSMQEFVELRGEVDAEDIAVIDAIVQANPGMTRMELVRKVIKAWAEKKKHEAMLIHRVTRCNGNVVAVERN